MHLSEADATLFFDLMWGLQIYVNEQLQLVPAIADPVAYGQRPLEEKVKVRAALYEHPELIDRFVQANPRALEADSLAIVSQWSKFVAGSFYVERYLKKYAIFIDDQDTVYGVLGLWEGLDSIIHKSRLPALVKAVLLPFKGQIVYDGLLQGHNLYFGSGIKQRLKQAYLTAKAAGGIVESLEGKTSGAAAKTPVRPSQDWGLLIEDVAQRAKVLRGGNGQPPLNGPVFSLIKASLELGQLATQEGNNHGALTKALDKVERALQKAEVAL